jgi:RNA recognition motif-containing protein
LLFLVQAPILSVAPALSIVLLPRGFAFVEMETPEESGKAIEMFNGQDFDGRVMNMSEARARESRRLGWQPLWGLY